jgi:DNA-binding CsgD family transcriptional regulator
MPTHLNRRLAPPNGVMTVTPACWQPPVTITNNEQPNSFESHEQLYGAVDGSNHTPRESKHSRVGHAAVDDFHTALIRGLWNTSMAALELLGIGLAICEPSARLLAANGTAEQILLDRDALQLNKAGELCAVVKDAMSMATIVDRVLTTEAHSEALLVPRTSGGRAITVFVRSAESNLNPARCKQALVMMLDGARIVETPPTDLHQLFRFTPQETRLANLLMAGKTVPEACDRLGIHVTTGCTHLRKIFKKTHTHRQGELVSLLLRSIGLVSRTMTRVAAGQAGNEKLQAERDDLSFSSLIQVDVDSSL